VLDGGDTFVETDHDLRGRGRGRTMRTVGEVMTSGVLTIDRDTRVSVVAGILEDERIGGAPLTDVTGSIVGIVTKSDIVHFEFVGGDPIEARVHEIASPRPIKIDASRPLAEAAQMMLEEQVHRLIVVDGESAVGILTSMDFVALSLESEQNGRS
jgi:CBS domain-containing protein